MCILLFSLVTVGSRNVNFYFVTNFSFQTAVRLLTNILRLYSETASDCSQFFTKLLWFFDLNLFLQILDLRNFILFQNLCVGFNIRKFELLTDNFFNNQSAVIKYLS
jgi:hypothetical protein